MTHAQQLPEFHIVVKRPGRGPLAPYRLAISILFALVISGTQIWAAAQTGDHVDETLIRFGVSGAFAWLVVGRINSILKAAAPPPSKSAGTPRPSGDPG